MEIRYREFIDQPDMREEVQKPKCTWREIDGKWIYRPLYGVPTEMVEFEDKIQRNLDLPDNLAYIDMGIESPVNTHLDVNRNNNEGVKMLWKKHRRGFEYQVPCHGGSMDDRDFRERCVRYGNQMFFIHQKLPSDMQPMLQLRPEWIQGHLECEFEDACTLSEAWRRLGYSKWMINKLVFGKYCDADGTWKMGLRHSGIEKSRDYAEYFEGLVYDLEEIESMEDELRGHYYDVSQRMIDSGEWYAQFSEEVNAALQMSWIESSVRNEFEEMEIICEEEIDEVDGFIDYFGDEMMTMRTSDAFGINALFDGNDCIDHELICEIKEASAQEIGKIQQRFFSKMTPYGMRKAHYWWMTGSQKERAWKFINARKDELKDFKLLSEHTKTVLNDIMNEVVSDNMKKAMVASFCNGRRFDLFGEIINWRKPAPNEVYAIWAEFEKGISQ